MSNIETERDETDTSSAERAELGTKPRRHRNRNSESKPRGKKHSTNLEAIFVVEYLIHDEAERKEISRLGDLFGWDSRCRVMRFKGPL